MTPIYLVAWSGGYDAPSYQVFTDAEKAEACAQEWEADMEDDGDWIDLLRIDAEEGTVVRITSLPVSEAFSFEVPDGR